MKEYQSEAELEAKVLLETGRLSVPTRHPTLIVWKNEVGKYIPLSDAMSAVEAALRPFGPDAVQAAKSALSRRIRVVGQKGSPDLLGAIEGRAFGLELKREHGGVVSEDQEMWHAVAREKKRMFVTVIRTVEEVAPALDRCRRGEVE